MTKLALYAAKAPQKGYDYYDEKVVSSDSIPMGVLVSEEKRK